MLRVFVSRLLPVETRYVGGVYAGGGSRGESKFERGVMSDEGRGGVEMVLLLMIS
jgi:hypothetical protein